MGDELKVIIPLDYYRKIMACADLVETEVTGFADCNYDEATKSFVIGKVHILEQEASGAAVEMDEEHISNFTYQMIQDGETQLPRCWWHSHVNMAVFFSGTDEEAIENLKNDSFVLALVVNKKREMKADAVMWKPFYYRWSDLPIEIDYSSYEIPEELRKEVEEKVKPEKKAVVTYPFQSNRQRKKNKKGGKWREEKPGVYRLVMERKVIRTLPKLNDEAEKVIWRENLSECYDKELEEDVWATDDRTLIYRDPWAINRDPGLFRQGKLQPVDEILDHLENKEIKLLHGK